MKTSKINPPRSVASVLCKYILNELRPLDRVVRQVGGGLPVTTISVERPDVVVSFTCLNAPHYRAKIRSAARTQSRDILLVRNCRSEDVFPVTADVTLAGGGLAPFDLRDLDLYRHTDRSLWLVPVTFGASILLTPDGLILEMVPPYSTPRERSAGVYRSTAEIAADLFPQVAR